jgi:hypothetical protein
MSEWETLAGAGSTPWGTGTTGSEEPADADRRGAKERQSEQSCPLRISSCVATVRDERCE